MPAQAPRVRVVVQLPYNRPDEPDPNPPQIEWNADKANILWDVIALSRTVDNGGTDWKGLAAHLEVPLPYLLYRAQARYEEDLRGLQDIRGVLSTPAPATSPTSPFPAAPSTPAIPTPRPADTTPDSPLSIKIPPAKLAGMPPLGSRRPSASQRVATPLAVRARLNSLTHKSPSKLRGGQGYAAQGKASSSSIATLQGSKRSGGPPSVLPRAASPLSDDAESESSDEEQAQRREEELERQAEEQEHLDNKLAQLQRMMTSERLGFVRSSLSPGKGKEREDARREDIIRGRPPFPASATPVHLGGFGNAPTSPSKLRFDESARLDVQLAEFTSAVRNRDHSASVSSTSSPQGSIPSIPSPSISSPSPPPPHQQPSSPYNHPRIPNQQQTQVMARFYPNSQPPSLAGSPMQRHLSPTKSSSPPAVSVRNARSHAHTRQGFGALGAAGVSEGESNHGSSASSFSDLSDADLSASALESALMSNIRGTGSRLSAITRSKLGTRGIRH